MNILLLLVPLSVMLLGLAAWAFTWAVRRGQFDDLDTPALDVLTDDREPPAWAQSNAVPRGIAHAAACDASAEPQA